MFQLQRLSDFGSSTPAVARTLPQGSDLLAFFQATETQVEACKQTLFELSNRLVRCVEIAGRVSDAVRSGLDGFSPPDADTKPKAMTIPGVPDLTTLAESYLQSAKLAIRDSAQLLRPFYGVDHDHRIHKLAKWSREAFGDEDLLTRTAFAWEPWIKEVVAMRNAVDHPQSGPRGRLQVENIRLDLDSASPVLLQPTWYLTDEPEVEVAAGMNAILEGLIRFQEDIMVALFHKFAPPARLAIYEIPVNLRRPEMPKRLRVGLVNEQ